MKRPWIYQYLLQTSRNRIYTLAIKNGKLDGAWEEALETLIKEEYKTGPYKDQIRPVLEMTGGSPRKAAKLRQLYPLTRRKSQDDCYQ